MGHPGLQGPKGGQGIKGIKGAKGHPGIPGYPGETVSGHQSRLTTLTAYMLINDVINDVG